MDRQNAQSLRFDGRPSLPQPTSAGAAHRAVHVVRDLVRPAAAAATASAPPVVKDTRTGRRAARPGKVLSAYQLRRAESYILSNLSSTMRIREVAKTVDLSQSYFSRAFKASVGVTFSDYLQSARVSLAKRLLLTTDEPICEVALICGLADQSHLTRLFRQYEGLPPSAWRRAHAQALVIG